MDIIQTLTNIHRSLKEIKVLLAMNNPETEGSLADIFNILLDYRSATLRSFFTSNIMNEFGLREEVSRVIHATNPNAIS